MDFVLPVVSAELFGIAAAVMLLLSLASKIAQIFAAAAYEELKGFIPHVAIIGSIVGCMFAGVTPFQNAIMTGFAIGVFAAGSYDTFVKPFVKKGGVPENKT